jgi:hypothetical protein
MVRVEMVAYQAHKIQSQFLIILPMTKQQQRWPADGCTIDEYAGIHPWYSYSYYLDHYSRTQQQQQQHNNRMTRMVSNEPGQPQNMHSSTRPSIMTNPATSGSNHKSQMQSIPRGSQKHCLRKIWKKLHADDNINTGSAT